jgi:hypothetical protein
MFTIQFTDSSSQSFLQDTLKTVVLQTIPHTSDSGLGSNAVDLGLLLWDVKRQLNHLLSFSTRKSPDPIVTRLFYECESINFHIYNADQDGSPTSKFLDLTGYGVPSFVIPANGTLNAMPIGKLLRFKRTVDSYSLRLVDKLFLKLKLQTQSASDFIYSLQDFFDSWQSKLKDPHALQSISDSDFLLFDSVWSHLESASQALSLPPSDPPSLDPLEFI